MRKAGEPVVIYRAANTQQANLLRNMLEEQGLAAWVQNDVIQAAAGELPLGWRGDSQVVVRDVDAQEAREIALDFERRLREHETAPSDFDESELADDDVWENWPRCPDCGERRHTRCPLCGMSSDHFRMVDREETDNGERVLLICDDCDESFHPTFYRLCHSCGHDFGEGYRVPGAAAARPAESYRTWLVMAAVVGIAALLGGYFFRLLSR